MKIFVHNFNIFAYVVSTVPCGIPRRKKIIKARYEDELSKVGPNHQNSIQAEFEVGYKYYGIPFDINNLDHFKVLISVVDLADTVTVHRVNEVIFTPAVTQCHGENIKLNNGWNVTVIGYNGVKHSKLFSGKCHQCNKHYYTSYEEITLNESSTKVRKYYNPNDADFFHVSTRTVFDIKLIKSMTYAVVIGKMQFRAFTKSYNLLHEYSIDVTTLINVFFAYHVARRIPGCPLVSTTTDSCAKFDAEFMCLQAFPFLKEVASDNYIKHVCTNIGCINRCVVMDGNEKNHRKLCNAPKEKVVDPQKVEPNVYRLCIRSPDLGKKSKFCKEHSSLDKADTGKESSTDIEITYRPKTRAFVKALSEKKPEVHEEACKNPKMCKVYFNRTCGIFSLTRPCGIRLGIYELYSQESLAQAAFVLYDKFGDNPSDGELKVIIYDRACELQPYLSERGNKGNTVFLNFSKKTFIVDTFHGDKHTKACCDIKSDKCMYNSRLDKYTFLQGCNYEACEQYFKELNKLKATTNYMSFAKRMTFFLIYEDEMNYILENEMIKSDKLVHSGSNEGYKSMTPEAYENLYSQAILNVSKNESINSNMATEFVKNLSYEENSSVKVMVTKL